MTEPTATIHRVQASLFPVNAYLIELPDGVVTVDATLGVSDGRALRARADALGKPLQAVLVTHTHPDHYGGVTALLDGDDIPMYALAGVNHAIRRDDPAKELIRVQCSAMSGPIRGRSRPMWFERVSAWRSAAHCSA